MGLAAPLASLFLVALAIAQQVPPTAPADPDNLTAIDGTTLGANRQPRPEVMLVLFDGQSRQYRTKSDALGRFSIPGIAPGRYRLIATSPGHKFASLDLTLAAGQHLTDLILELEPLATLSGKVTDEDGEPMQGVTVIAMSPQFVINGLLRFARASSGIQTSADGLYQIMVPPGRYRLSFSAPRAAPNQLHRGYATAYFPGVLELPLASDIDATTGEQMSGLNVRLRETTLYHVRGKVAGSIPPDLWDLRIIASQETGDVLATHMDKGEPTKPDGTFDIASLAPGTWMLTLAADLPRRRTLGRLTVHVGDRDVEDVVIAAHASSDLSGSLKFMPNLQTAVSQPVHVRLTSLDDISISDFSVEAPLRSDGSFALKDVEFGRYRVDLIVPPGGFVKSVTFGGRDCLDSGIDFSGGAAPPLCKSLSV